MNNIIELLSYPFFVRSLVSGVVLGMLLSWLSVYIVIRKEVFFTHAVSHMAFLGIALALIFNFSTSLGLLFTTLISALVIYFLKKKKLFSGDSIFEILAQTGLTGSVILIAIFSVQSVSLEKFLFGDILAITDFDMVSSVLMLFVFGFILLKYHKSFLELSLSDMLSHTSVKNKGFLDLLLMLIFAFTISISMKILGILLVSAFITIPANVARVFATSLKRSFFYSVGTGLFGSVFGLFFSAVFDVPSGASIVMFLILFWLFALLVAQFRRPA